MPTDTLFRSDLTFAKRPLASKKRCLEFVAQSLATVLSFDEQSVFEGLVARERLGTTGIGNGIALPHCRFSGTDALHAVMVTLAEPVDFDSIDQQPVDLIVALIAPAEASEQHLQALSQIAEMLQEPGKREALCSARNNQALWELISHGAV